MGESTKTMGLTQARQRPCDQFFESFSNFLRADHDYRQTVDCISDVLSGYKIQPTTSKVFAIVVTGLVLILCFAYVLKGIIDSINKEVFRVLVMLIVCAGLCMVCWFFCVAY